MMVWSAKSSTRDQKQKRRAKIIWQKATSLDGAVQKKSCQYLLPFKHNAQNDRQTDRQTDRSR